MVGAGRMARPALSLFRLLSLPAPAPALSHPFLPIPPAATSAISRFHFLAGCWLFGLPYGLPDNFFSLGRVLGSPAFSGPHA